MSSSSSGDQLGAVAVVKMGGSVLTGRATFQRAAEFVLRRLNRRPAERLVLVVSAERGMTDALLRLAQELVAEPDAAALDLLWSTGELRSVALMTLALHAQGVPAVGLSVHETGLVVPDGNRGGNGIVTETTRLKEALAQFPVVVAPGFLARRPAGAIMSLGRGGTDLTAVLLAASVRAPCCELIKDVPGYFSKDPQAHADAQHLPALTFEQALEMADAGCDLVQKEALEAARRLMIPLVVGGLGESAPQSWVGPPRTAPQTDSRAAGCAMG